MAEKKDIYVLEKKENLLEEKLTINSYSRIPKKALDTDTSRYTLLVTKIIGKRMVAYLESGNFSNTNNQLKGISESTLTPNHKEVIRNQNIVDLLFKVKEVAKNNRSDFIHLDIKDTPLKYGSTYAKIQVINEMEKIVEDFTK